MRLIVYCFFTFFVSSFHLYAQESLSNFSNQEFNNSILDFLANKNQEVVNHLDSIKQLSNSPDPITSEDIDIFKRSKSLTKTIPLDYNDNVKYYIEKYTSTNYRPYMNKLLGLSKHYFPIYEPILKESGLPEEVKYLSLVESSLNPHLVSSSGAVGPWQFMYVAAKEYNLEINSSFDERKDPYSSSYAVSQYLNSAYSMFGDWLLALASYNCGRGCVQRAILKSGIERPNFWELSPFLPQETRNYIPKYIAMTYVLSDPSYYGIYPDSTDLNLDHKVVFVDKKIDLQNVAKAIGMQHEDLKKYNPAFKSSLITGSPEKPKRLLLPLTNSINDSLLYLVLNDESFVANTDIKDSQGLFEENGVKKYRVQEDESLWAISKKVGASVEELRAWNGLTKYSSILGKELIVDKVLTSEVEKNSKSLRKTQKKKSSTIIYTVKKGDSLDRIANQYSGISVTKLKADNGLKSDMIKPGMKIKINKNVG